MSDILNTLKRYGRFLAILPFLSASAVTVPKLYLEIIGTNVFGTREVLKAEVVERSRTDAGSSIESCQIKIKIRDSYRRETLDCADWNQVQRGDLVDRVDAWTVFSNLDEVFGHAVLDAVLLLIEILMILFFLNIRAFIAWIERESRTSSPIFNGHPQRKEKL